MRLLKLLKAAIPSRLPITTEELEQFTKDILDLGGWPLNDANSHAVAMMILHLDISFSYKPKLYFYLTLRRSVSNEIAYARMEELKRKQAESKKASDEASKEVTAAVGQEA